MWGVALMKVIIISMMIDIKGATKDGSHIPLENGTERAKLVITIVIEKRLVPPMITGLRTIEQGDTLMLTCEAQSSPELSIVTWTKAGSHILLETGTERAKLVIPNATRDHSGHYSCTAQHVQTTKTISSFANVNVLPRSVPILEELCSGPGVVYAIIISFALIGVLACIYCLAKTFHRCTRRNHQVPVGNGPVGNGRLVVRRGGQ